jgi:cysteine desulfurase / selenocysteine lyase
MPSRIYLDNAATSWPKRNSVLQAAWQFATECGATAGRGSYASSQVADKWISDARRNLARLIGAQDPRSIGLCSSGTHALNAVIHGLLGPGDHVITSDIEHNSVLRPLKWLSQHRNVSFDFVESDAGGVARAELAKELVRNNTKLIVIGHASNVSGTVQDIASWSSFAKKCNALLAVDVSQTLGYLPIDVNELGIDVLASAGHKGLGAMQGTGLIYLASELQSQMQPLMTGGTGVKSESIDAELNWPQTVEVGNYNMTGIVSMAVAADELNHEATESNSANWQNSWRTPYQQLIAGLRELPTVHLVGFPSISISGQQPVDRVPLVSLTVDGWSVHDLASVLDSSFGIEVRAGYHCAALVHQSLGTVPSQGTLRISLGHSTTEAEIAQLLIALREIVGIR